jgi:hypothetical protein
VSKQKKVAKKQRSFTSAMYVDISAGGGGGGSSSSSSSLFNDAFSATQTI